MRFIKLLSLFMIFIITGCQVQPILETPTRLPAPQTLTTPVPSETPILRTLSPTPIPTSPIPSFTPLPLSTATSIAYAIIHCDSDNHPGCHPHHPHCPGRFSLAA